MPTFSFAVSTILLLAQAAAVELHSSGHALLRVPNAGELEGQLLKMITGGEEDFKPVNGTAFDDDNVDKLAQGLAKLRAEKRKATPEMMGFVKTVTKLINNDMVPKIIAGHNKSVDTLKVLMDAFSQCKGTRQGEMDKIKKKVATIKKTVSTHKTCRRKQQTSWRQKTDCTKLVKTKYALYKSDCAREKALTKPGAATEADFCHTTNAAEPYGQFILRNYRFFKAKERVYNITKAACDDSRLQYQTEKPKCDKKIAFWKSKRGECNGVQDNLEGRVCGVSKHLIKTCTEYRACYMRAMKDLSDQEPIIRKMVKDRKGEWRALKRIECLLGVFSSEDGEVDGTVIDTCKKKTHSTKHLDIKFPKVPARQRCQAIPPTPCSAPYYARFYAKLPKNAKAKECAQCTLKTSGFGVDPTYWLTAEDYVPKMNTWYNKGTANDIHNLALRGSARLNLDSGNGARSRLVAVTGSYRTVLNFGRIISKRYTICSLTRYTSSNGHYRKRILNGAGRNWLHGHWMGRAGAVYYSGWKAGWRRSTVNPSTNWAAVCAKNAGGGRPRNVLVNGRATAKHSGGLYPPGGMMVNAGVYGNEKSDFAIHEILVWNSPLTDYHMNKAMSYLMGKLKAKAGKKEMARRTAIVKQDIKPTYWLTADKWNPATGGWKNQGTSKDLKNVITRGKLWMSLEAGYGSSSKMLAIRGSRSTYLNFGNILSSHYTMCSLSRYTSSNAHHRKRILMGKGVNWLHGHWMGRAGAVYYHGWKAGWARTTVNPNTKWVALCASNDGPAPTNVIVNGRATGVHQGGVRPHALTVNQGVWGNEKSDFAIAEIKIWNQGLSKYHMNLEMNKLLLKMQKSLTPKQEIKFAALARKASEKDMKR